MYQVRKITQDMFWIGGNDRRLALFENVYPIPDGVSYNSYLILDEKTVLMDTVDKSVSGVFFENIEYLLKDRTLDYLIVNHMEPDHCAMIAEVILRYPRVRLVGGSKTLAMLRQFFSFELETRFDTVAEGDVLCTGRHTFSFVMAPMVHWPEAMVTYDTTDKVLYSADAFGSFGALRGNMFADEINLECGYMDEARRYYTNIVGKYGNQVQALLKKAAGIEISIIAPLHGLLWRKNLNIIIDKYIKWSTYTPEENAVMIAYASVYGNTQNAAELLAAALNERGIRNIRLYDVSVTHASYIVAEAFRCSHLVFASTTYNAGIFVNMENLLHDIKAHNLQNRTVALMENGSWAATSGTLMRAIFDSMKNITVLTGTVSIKSSVKSETLGEIESLAQDLSEAMLPKEEKVNESLIESSAMFKLSYGLFVLTARDKEKDNGCIINTVMQVTDNPKRIAIAVNKANLTHDMILSSSQFTVSVLTTETPFGIFEHFGFRSGRDTDKFEGYDETERGQNGIIFVRKYANAYISGRVIAATDLGTHTEFLAEITEAAVLSNIPSATYQYYFDNIKPKPQPAMEQKKGYVCKICGYVYEGEVLPPDYICPLCKHGAEDFEPL